MRSPRVEATRRLVEADPDVAILVLTVSAEGEDIDGALAAGAAGYLLKDASAGELVVGVRAAAAGEASLSPPVASRLVASVRDAHRVSYDDCGGMDCGFFGSMLTLRVSSAY